MRLNVQEIGSKYNADLILWSNFLPIHSWFMNNVFPKQHEYYRTTKVTFKQLHRLYLDILTVLNDNDQINYLFFTDTQHYHLELVRKELEYTSIKLKDILKEYQDIKWEFRYLTNFVPLEGDNDV